MFTGFQRYSIKNIALFIATGLLGFVISCNKEVNISQPEPQPNSGFIFIESKPQGARIYLNGLNTGRNTPDSITWLDSGYYKILLRLPGWKDSLINVFLTVNERKYINLDFTVSPAMLGTIYCTSTPPGVNIIFNDSILGRTTPDYISGLLPGRYKIKYNKINYLNDSVYVNVESQKVTEAHIDMVDTIMMVIYNTHNSNIPTNSVLSIATDKNNLKWIGTDGAGLCTYDGVKFTTYNNSNSLLPDNRIASIYIDGQDNKWIGTTSGGLVKISGSAWILYNSTNTTLPEMTIVKITGDNTGKIWIGTWGNGLISFDGVNSTIYNQQNTGLPINIVNDVAIDNENTVYAATNFGIAKYSGNTWDFYDNNDGCPKQAIALVCNYNNDLYASFKTDDNEAAMGMTSFAYLSENTWTFLSSHSINFFSRDRHNLIWFGTLSSFGYVERRRIRDEWGYYNSTFPEDVPLSIADDKGNLHWIGTRVSGLVKLKR